MTWPDPLPDQSYPDQRYWEHSRLAMEHGVTSRESFLELVYELGSTPNGVFGAKLMWNYTPHVIENFMEMPRFADMGRAEIFRAAFPGLHVVHLSRRNRLRQAVSWLRAAEDGVWWVSDTEPPQPQGLPRYNYDVIEGMMALITQGEQAWRELYDELGITSLEIAYEDLLTAESYENAVKSILADLVMDMQVVIPRQRTNRQSDDLNEEWIERFLHEHKVRHGDDRPEVLVMTDNPPGMGQATPPS